MIVLGGLGRADEHDTGPHHPERPARLDAAILAVDDVEVDSRWAVPREATKDELALVHQPEYIDAVEELCRSGGGRIDADTRAAPGSWDTAIASAGAGLAAVEAVASGEASSGFVLTRPPGHHARPMIGMGFCLFNNIAVSAARLSLAGERVAVIDWDVHHGNGTQEMFWDDPSVLYVSTHQWPLYPMSGAATETGGTGAPGGTVNIPLPPGATGDAVRTAFDEVVAPALAAFDPTWTLVSAGFDGHRDDPLAELMLTSGDYADLTSWVLGIGKPTVLFLEGGYDLSALRRSVGAALGALGGRDYRPEPASSGGPGSAEIATASRAQAEFR